MVSLKQGLLVFFSCLISNLNSVQATSKTEMQVQTIRVAVASNFKSVLEQLSGEFERQNPALQVQISSASSGVLYAQIIRGAPFDLFLSADRLRPTLLDEQGLIRTKSRVTYARGKLALWSTGKAVNNLNELQQYAGKIAIANPELAPFGRASLQVLSAIEWWPANKHNLVMANNVLQVAHMLHSGALNLGMVSASQIKNVPNNQLWFIPEELFSPIEQQMVILSPSSTDEAHMQGVKTFYRYILSFEGQQIIANNGYVVTNNTLSTTKIADE